MADRAEGRISFTPIVTISADADADSVDAIHHDIKSALGGPLTYTVADGADKWYYAPNVIVTNSSQQLICGSDDNTDLVGASGDPANGPNEAAGNNVHTTDGAATLDGGSDIMRFIFIKNTGESDVSGTTTTNSVYFTLDTATSSHSTSDAIEVGAGEAFMARIGCKVAGINIISGQARTAGTASTVNGSTSVRCTVAAIIDDASGI